MSSLRGRGNLEKKAVTLLCVSSLRGHGNLARRIKLTRVTKENLRLKILEVKGASCVGDPCNSIRGASPGLASPEQASGKSQHAHILAASHGQCGRAVYGGGSRRHSVRAWVRTPPLSVLHVKQIGAGGPKPEHFSGHATILFLLLLDVFKESPSSRNHERSGAVVSVSGS